jgi:hypothetical protein
MTILLLWPLLFFQPGSVYTVGGIAISNATNGPLNKTSVSLTSLVEGSPPRTLVTDSEGRFRFDGLIKGKYSLTAERNGFVRQSYKQRSLYQPYASAIAVGENEQTENIVFKLIPSSAITGYVKDLHGDPVRGILVRVYRIVGAAGQKRAQTALTGSTDDRGYYRIHSLAAGTYVLALNARAWKYEQAQELNPSAFPVTFFPGTTDADHAGTLRVEAGQEARADVVVDPVTSVQLKGTVAPQAGVRGSLSVSLAAKGPFGVQFPVAEQVAVYDNQFTLQDVPAGRYELSLWEDQTHLRGMRSIEVTNPDQQVTIGDIPLPQLLVRVQVRGAAPKQPSQTIVILGDIDGAAALTIVIPPDGNLFLPQVPPGRYRIAVAQKTQLPILSVTARGATLHSDRIDVPEAGKIELSLVVDRAAADLNGRAVKGERGEPGVFVMLVPRNGWENTSAYRFDQSDSDGTFVWHGVTKGEYLMFTLDSGEPDDYADPEAVRGLLPQGQPLTVTGDAGQNVLLQLPGR